MGTLVNGNNNKKRILNIVRNSEEISRAELANITTLSLPTVMKLVDEFIEKGLIIDIGAGASTGGKPPKMLKFNFISHFIIGIDIDSDRIDGIIMDMAANVICSSIHDIGHYTTSDQVTDYIVVLIEKLINESGISQDRILGVGIGIEGIVDTQKRILKKFHAYDWENVDFVTPIKERFPFTVIVDNNTRAMAIGEKLVGIAKEVENFICVNVNYDVDSAMVIDGNLYYGAHSSAGAMGHMTVAKDGLLCECGRRGCLNTVVSPRYIEAVARERVSHMKLGQSSQILDMAFGHVDYVDMYILMDAAENKDALAIEILKSAAADMAIALMNVVCMINPQMIIINGKIVSNSRVFFEELKRRVTNENNMLTESQIKIIKASLGKHLNAIGAASFVLDRFIENGGILPPD